jgi:BNR repeat-like domain
MEVISRYRKRLSIAAIFTLLALVFSLVFVLVARGFTHAAGETLMQISHDPFTNKTSQHHTEVEPSTLAFGNTIVSAFQQGRFWNGGASDIGFATSTDRGKTFTHGSMPGLTVFSTPPGVYQRASDAAVAYDAKHKVWLVSSLGIINPTAGPVDVVVNRSTDGGLTWSNAITVAAENMFFDKNWTTCDDTSTSPFYGNCYTEFDNPSDGDRILMSTSTDGGLTWGPPQMTANHAHGIGGQPLVQPNGRVIVPIIGFTGAPAPDIKVGEQVVPNSAAQPFRMMSFISINGGASWSATFKVSEIDFRIPQGIRSTIPLPSAEIDASGKVYTVWEDCRFEKGCSANDLVLSTSTNGVQWTTPRLIPIDHVGSGVDHFIPGLAVDRTTSGSSAHLGLDYYYYPVANCQTANCLLTVGFISSVNGGTSWSKAEQIAGPMLLQWLALTTQGYMTGDYISTAIVPGAAAAIPVFEVAQPPTGNPPKGFTCISSGVVCHEATFTTPENLAKLVGGTNTAGNDSTFVPPPWTKPVAHTAN